jgi:hypothetical protein
LVECSRNGSCGRFLAFGFGCICGSFWRAALHHSSRISTQRLGYAVKTA